MSPNHDLNYAILAEAASRDERTRVLKHGDTFGLFDHHGDIVPGGLGEQGLYCGGTRFLSRWMLELLGRRPFFLGGNFCDERRELTSIFTNPDLTTDAGARLPLGSIHLTARSFLWRDALHEELRVTNHSGATARLELALHFAADYADIFEVRGMQRATRGIELPAEVSADQVTLGYRGLDDVVRRTALRFSPPPTRLTDSVARFILDLAPGERRVLDVELGCDVPVGAPARTYAAVRAEAGTTLERRTSWPTIISTGEARADAWIDRAIDDVHLLTTELRTGPYPYAGVPWFSTPFGRDGIITALQCLWLRPALARGVLRFLASMQAIEQNGAEDCEPGKILHETRGGEMARLREIPFGRYYGTIDATPLFVVLAAAYLRRTGDLELVRALWPNVLAAMEWCRRRGDRDGDGFLEYGRATPDGLLHQGWKDSDDAVMHADGRRAQGPIALAEVQGYLYAAYRGAAMLADAVGHRELAADFAGAAETLRVRFDAAFWCDELGTYALALDGDKRPCRVASSNAGQCLFTGIVRPDRVPHLASTLMAPTSFSGWGIRTLATDAPGYNPMGYHVGSIWPHDNALIALGLARHGRISDALAVFSSQFAAARCFDLHRMPELFCGFDRRDGEMAVPYPVACAPQAWAAGAVLMLLQACLGLDIDGAAGRVVLTRPHLPPELDHVRISELEVSGAAHTDVVLERGRDGVARVVHARGAPVVVLR